MLKFLTATEEFCWTCILSVWLIIDLGRVVWSWVKITQGWCEFWTQIWELKLKSKFNLIFFAYNLIIIGCSKRNRENFDLREQLGPELSDHRPVTISGSNTPRFFTLPRKLTFFQLDWHMPLKFCILERNPWIVFRDDVVLPSWKLILPESWDESKTDFKGEVDGFKIAPPP